MSDVNSNSIRNDRQENLKALKAAGQIPYPAKTKRTHSITEVLEQYELLETAGDIFTIAGRVMSIRGHGAIMFISLDDGTGSLQVFASRDALGNELFDLLKTAINTGDFIEATGSAYTTKRGTKALGAGEWLPLSKALANLPTTHFGLKEDDERYRKRYLDILLNPEVKDMFLKKAIYWKASRRFLENKGFLEVHTPTLEVTTGGAEAKPFTTHHDDFDIDVYLRISIGELWQKRLMAAGLQCVFEVGRAYRNEGTSPDHLQEFTNIEFYAAYMNFTDGLNLLEEHIRYVLDEVFGGQRLFQMKEFTIDFTEPFKRIDYVETVKEKTGVDVLLATDTELAATVKKLEIEHEGDNRERLTDTLWKYCRKNIAGPLWLTGHPKLVSPLAKENPEQTGKVLRAQLIMAGTEFNNCFAELNDPLEQAARFKEQEELLKAGDNEAMMPDWEFVKMLEHGMPPTFGASTLGDRFFAYLVDQPIRETQYFPLMKPRDIGDTN